MVTPLGRATSGNTAILPRASSQGTARSSSEVTHSSSEASHSSSEASHAPSGAPRSSLGTSHSSSEVSGVSLEPPREISLPDTESSPSEGLLGEALQESPLPNIGSSPDAGMIIGESRVEIHHPSGMESEAIRSKRSRSRSRTPPHSSVGKTSSSVYLPKKTTNNGKFIPVKNRNVKGKPSLSRSSHPRSGDQFKKSKTS